MGHAVSPPTPRSGLVPSAVGRPTGGPRSGVARSGIPFVAVHLGVLAVPFVGWSPVAAACCVALYVVRALGITVIYHRGLAHRAFSMSRGARAVGAAIGASAAQRGPLWWVANHRVHHRFSDQPGDPHSPVLTGFWRSHIGWLFEPSQPTDRAVVADLERCPELRLLDRFHHAAPTALAVGTYLLGVVLGIVTPALGTSGPQMLVWGFFVSTTALYHSTFAVNSVAHRFGRRRFDTKDDSRNNWIVALLTLGEGWHNNHHRFPRSPRHGLARHELDPSWWAIRAMLTTGIASSPARVPRRSQTDGWSA